MNTILWQYIEASRAMVILATDMAIDDAEWDTYIAKLHELYNPGLLRRVLVFSDGPGPNPRQRSKLRYEPKFPLETAVLTHSIVGRGVVTALSWFYPIRAFAPIEVEQAFDYLTVPRSERASLRKVVATLRMRLNGASPTSRALMLTESSGELDSILTDRLPQLRERIQREDHLSRAG